jgi:cytochrome c556
MRPMPTALAATLTLALTLALPGAALADEAAEAALKARQSLMSLIAYNLGPMAQMAQGRIDYDAAAAQAAADNLHGLTRHSQERLWPEGTANGEREGSRALPAVWENLEEFAMRYATLQDATTALQAVAGDGLQAVQGALGGVGGACRDCHQTYRLTD